MSDSKTLMKEMLASAVHFGHKTSKWNPKMAPYIYTQKNGVHVFDLNQTVDGLNQATEFLRGASAQGKTILFVSTKRQATQTIKEAAERCHMPYVTSKWIPGLLTNFKTIRARMNFLEKLKHEKETGEFDKYTKKEASDFDKQIEKLEMALGGVLSLERVPDVVFIVDVCRDRIAVQEANKMGITVVAVVDSNANPDGIDFVIPGNDDANKAIKFFVEQAETAIKAGKSQKA